MKSPRRRSLVSGALLVSLFAISQAPADGIGRAQISLHLTDAAGGALSNATVAVYLSPYDPPPIYKPPLISRGTTLSDGSFSLDLGVSYRELLAQTVGDQCSTEFRATCTQMEDQGIATLDQLAATADSGITHINARVKAVDANKTELLLQSVILPLYDSYEETLAANLPLPSDLANVSADAIVQEEVSFCLPAPDPDENDPYLGVIEVESTSDRPENPAECPGVIVDPDGTPKLEDGALERLTNYDPVPEKCVEQYGPPCEKTWRFTKVVAQHVGQGMKGTFRYATARETRTETAVTVDFQNWSVGGWATEATTRSDGREFSHDGAFHRERFARYRYYLWAHCGRASGCYWKWEPHHWTWGFSRSTYQDPQPQRYSQYQVNIGTTKAWRASGSNETFGVGLQLAGLYLGSQAGYSENTKLVWDGQGRCAKNWLYGRNTDPAIAPTVYAESEQC